MFKAIPPLAIGLALMAGDSRPWADKAISDWTEDDAKLVLSDSPWVKTVQPTLQKPSDASRGSRGMGHGGGMGRGGIGMGGVGIGLPGMGGVGRRGGYPGGGYPGGGYPQGGGYPGGPSGRDQTQTSDSMQIPELRLRWESALPVRAAELKTHEASSPVVEESQYAIAVYGLSDRFVKGDPESLAKQLKKEAALKREGKSDIKPSGVDVLQRSDGPIVVYLFPRSKEISSKDDRIEFDAQIGRLKLAQSFSVSEMTCQGKLEL